MLFFSLKNGCGYIKIAVVKNMEMKKKSGGFVMTHYKQIIVNLAIEDRTDADMLKEFAEEIKALIEEKQKEHENIKEVSVKVN